MATQPRTPADKPLFLHALAMREYLEAGWVDKLYWFDTLAMLADGLTKGAVDREDLVLVCEQAPARRPSTSSCATINEWNRCGATSAGSMSGAVALAFCS